MRYLLAPVMMVLLLTSCVHAQNDTKKDKPKTAQEQFESYMDELEAARAEASKAFRDAKTAEEKEKIRPEFLKKLQAMSPRMLELAEKNAKEPVSGEAELFVLSISTSVADQEKALGLLLKNQADRAPDACMVLAQSPNAETNALLNKVLEMKDGSNKAKASATLGLAFVAKRHLEDVDPTSADGIKFSRQAEDLFEQIISKYKDVKEAFDAAEGELFVLKNLSIGKVAPDIEGYDSDGKKFKLSDYRGKVVVLDFWALWCERCMGLVPSERELAKRLEGKPFAIIGVDCDESKEDLKKGEKDHGITWRSFHDGRQGPIGDKWRIAALPAIFVLDSKGVIRFKDVREKKMDAAVDALLKEMGATTKN